MRVRSSTTSWTPIGPARAESGFSLIELIVSITIFSLLIGTLVALIATGLSVARNNKDRSVGAHLASQEMDGIRQLPFSRISIGQATHNVTVNSVSYKIKTDTDWVANSSTSNSCDSTGSAPRVLRVTVEVTWPNMRGTEPVRTSTEISPPVGSYDPDNGHIAVRVRDRNATALGGIPVRVTGPGVDVTQTTTDTVGCAFFGFLPPASYAVTLGTTGWVDRQSNAVPSQTVGVSAGNITSVAFDYDEAATITMTLAGARGGVPAGAVPLTLANTGLLPAGTKSFPGTGVVRTLTSLFPYSDGYTAWAGSCDDADPEGADGTGTRYWPGAQRDNAISVDPGGTVAATLTMSTLNVQFERDSGSGSVTVVAVHAADTMCGSGETLTLTAFSGTSGNQLVALPYGTWTIQALGQTAASAWNRVVLSPNDTSTADVDVHIR